MNFKAGMLATTLLLAAAGGAHAQSSFYSTFESVPGSPTPGNFTVVSTADGWTGGTNGIELQNNIAGAPAADGGTFFVELDAYANSTMFRTIDAGSYTLSWEYSPRPNEPASTNGIEALLNGVVIDPPGLITGTGGASTSWSTYSATFNAPVGSVLSFAAEGTSDSFGGYIDNISLTSAAPEPTTWALLLGGIGLIGVSLRRASARCRQSSAARMAAA